MLAFDHFLTTSVTLNQTEALFHTFWPCKKEGASCTKPIGDTDLAISVAGTLPNKSLQNTALRYQLFNSQFTQLCKQNTNTW